MTTETVDTRGLKSPDCIIKIIKRAVRMKSGSILEVWGDSPTFEKDVKAWCEETARVILSVERDGEATRKVQLKL